MTSDGRKITIVSLFRRLCLRLWVLLRSGSLSSHIRTKNNRFTQLREANSVCVCEVILFYVFF